MKNPLDAYKVITPENFEGIKTVLLEASISQWSADKTVEELQKIGLNTKEAWGLVDVEFEGTAFGALSVQK